MTLANLGEVARVQQQADVARARYRQGLATYQRLGGMNGVAVCLEGLAAVARLRGDLGRAARLFGAVDQLASRLGTQRGPRERAMFRQDVDALRAAMAAGDRAPTVVETFEHAWEAGAALPIEEAIALALEDAPRVRTGSSALSTLGVRSGRA